MTGHLLGAAAALASAFLWAVAALLFRRLGDQVPAIGINLAKGAVALVFLAMWILPAGFAMADASDILLLAASGLVGIALGDTLYFHALVRLGPRITLLLGTLIPAATAVMAVVLLGERVAAPAWLGLAMTLGGVAYVLWERSADGAVVSRRHWLSGIVIGALFIAAEAAGIILTKLGVANTGTMEATFIRTVFAVAGMTVWGLAAGSLWDWVRPLKDKRVFALLTVASFVGAFLGTWLAVSALKYTHAAVAATLNATSPLFILPLAAWFAGERVSRRAIGGALMAVAGIGVYFGVLTYG